MLRLKRFPLLIFHGGRYVRSRCFVGFVGTCKDNRAYQYLYQCYYVALKALANYYVKDNDVAEDLVQDVFISLLESDYKFKTENDIKYFLYSSLEK